jgi:hypothetical protein
MVESGGFVLTLRLRHGSHEKALFLVAFTDDIVVPQRQRVLSQCIELVKRFKSRERAPRWTLKTPPRA